jgi:hypothetical protein
VVGKWGIGFVMSSIGPDSLHLEKLSKSCPENQRPSSRRHRPAKS